MQKQVCLSWLLYLLLSLNNQVVNAFLHVRKMYYKEEIKEKLGSENVDNVLKEIRNGRTNDNELEQIAKYMGNNVYGVYVQNRKKESELTYLFQLMLDCWYNDSLCEKSNEEAQKELYDIIQKVGLKPIAQNLKILESSAQER